MQQLLACINACLRTHFSDSSTNLPEGSSPSPSASSASTFPGNTAKESKNSKSRGLTTSILTTFRDELQVHVLNVTPLGQTMGLVQWVPKSTTLYDIFCSWQARMHDRYAAAAAAAAPRPDSKTAPLVGGVTASGAQHPQHARHNSAVASVETLSDSVTAGVSAAGGKGRGKGRGGRGRGARGGSEGGRDTGGRSRTATAAAHNAPGSSSHAAALTAEAAAAHERALAQATKAILHMGKQEFPQLPEHTEVGINSNSTSEVVNADTSKHRGIGNASDSTATHTEKVGSVAVGRESGPGKSGLKGAGQREQAAWGQRENAAIPNLPPIVGLKPTELFYSVLQQELRAAGLVPQLPRSEWPAEVRALYFLYMIPEN